MKRLGGSFKDDLPEEFWMHILMRDQFLHGKYVPAGCEEGFD